MLRLTLEVVPHGNESRARTIGVIEIVNTGDHPGRPEYGNYRGTMGDREVEVTHHRRDDGAWKLVRRVLRALGNK
jgi:hypothetical protein